MLGKAQQKTQKDSAVKLKVHNIAIFKRCIILLLSVYIKYYFIIPRTVADPEGVPRKGVGMGGGGG